MAVGVIHVVLRGITEDHLMATLCLTSHIVRVRRLGDAELIALMFASATLPEAVTMGYVHCKTNVCIEKPHSVYTLCGRLGHVAAACQSPSSCARCGKVHEVPE